MASSAAIVVPDQTGRVIVVTGANSGIGWEAARMFAGAGAHVVLACRSEERGREAASRIEETTPGASTSVIPLDLSRLRSVRAFAATFADRHEALHVLVNNAGVMALPRSKTEDGFEMQIGVNHLGHFALTGLLWPRMRDAAAARVVNVASTVHWVGKIRWDDLHWERGYQKWPAYAQSKLANLLFTRELSRRVGAAGGDAIAVACHPGYASTNLQARGPQMTGSRMMERLFGLGNRTVAQTARMGALPTVHAATAPDVAGGEYYGPDGLLELTGRPSPARMSNRARDDEAAARLWALSERETRVAWDPAS